MFLRYWKGLIIPTELIDCCQSEIEQLKAGHFKSLDLEKLHTKGETLYSIRVNLTDRLILTEHQGILVVLDYISNHNYQSCHFLKSRGILHYLKHKLGLKEEEQIAPLFTSVENEEIDAFNQKLLSNETKPAFLELHGGKWVELTESQQNITHEKLPLIVFGPGGSGKSTIALSMLLEHTLTNPPEALPCLYLSESPILVNEIQKQFYGMCPHDMSIEKKISFSTIRDLLIHHLNIPGQQLVSKEHFLLFWEKNNFKISSISRCQDIHVDILWEEMCIFAACDSEQEYQTLNEFDSLIPREKRSIIIQLFRKYTRTLIAEKLYSYDLLRYDDIKSAFSLILIDEAQNLPPVLARIISHLSTNHQVVYFSGEQQMIKGHINNYSRIKAYYYSHSIPLSKHSLNTTHRCSLQVTRLVNELMHLKRQILGGKTQKDEITELEVASKHSSNILWIAPENIAEFSEKIHINSADFAIVTLNEHVDELKNMLPKAVIFTVAEAQGLEFKNLMVYQVLKPQLYGLLLGSVDKIDSKNRSKRDKINLTHSQDLDLFITAVMRAEGNLTIVQPAQHRYAHEIYTHFYPFLNQETHETTVDETEQDWENKAHYYINMGHIEQARHIWLNVLERPLNSFPQLIEKSEKALSPPTYSPEDKKFIETWFIKSQKSKKSLQSLMEYARLSTILMNLEIDRYDCLMDYIIHDPNLKNSFINISDHCLFKKILKSERLSDGFLWIDYVFEKCPEILVAMVDKHYFCSEFYALNYWNNLRLKRWLDQPIYGFPILQKILSHSKKHLEHFFSELILTSLSEISKISLFEKIIQNEDGIQFLLFFCTKPPILKILSQQLFNQFAAIIQNTHGRQFLLLLLKKNPECIQYLSHQMLYEHKEDINTSCFFLLCKTREAIPLLLLIYSLRNDLTDFPESLLYQNYPSSNKRENAYSAFFWLCTVSTGAEVLQLLFEKNSKLLEVLSIEILCAVSNNSTRFSPLFSLSRTFSGCELLLFLFKKNPKLKTTLSIDALYTVIPNHCGPLSGTSTLYCLSASKSGSQVLHRIFEQNIQLIKKITDNMLYHTVPEQSMPQPPMFFWLSRMSNGIRLLQMIFDHHPTLINGLSVEILCQTYSEESNITSAFFWLCGYKEGCDLLQILFENKPILLQELSFDTLWPSQEITSIEQTKFYKLASREYGCKLLKYMFSNNLTYVSQLSMNILCHLLPEKFSELPMPPLFYWLTTTETGCDFLLYVFKNNPQLIENLQIKTLSYTLFNETNIKLNKISLLNLSVLNSGKQLLKFIFENNTRLSSQLLSKHLYKPHPEFFEGQLHVSPIFHLSQSEQGCEILKLIFISNKTLVQQLPLEELCCTVHQVVDHISTSIFDNLCMNEQGHQVLSLILTENTHLIGSLLIDTLCLSLDSSQSQSFQTSAFYKLVSTTTGLTVLKIIFTTHPELSNFLSDEVFCKPFPSKPNHLDNKTVFDWLLESAKGHQLLKIFIDNHRSLISVLHQYSKKNSSSHSDEPMLSLLDLSSDGLYIKEKIMHLRLSLFSSPTYETRNISPKMSLKKI